MLACTECLTGGNDEIDQTVVARIGWRVDMEAARPDGFYTFLAKGDPILLDKFFRREFGGTISE